MLQQLRLTVMQSISWQEQFLENLAEATNTIKASGGNILWALVKIIVILLLARMLIKLLSNVTRIITNSNKWKQTEKQAKRTTTLMTLFHSTSRYLIYFIAIVAVFEQLGFHNIVSNLMVTAGIGSVAIGFGAQSLVKDVVTGFFMMFENQLSVGDYVKIGDSEGFVEATAMRVTYLRTRTGEQIIIPNGTIDRIINYSVGNNRAFITISTAYETDTEVIISLLKDNLKDFANNHKDIIEEPPVVTGITAFTAFSVDIGISCKTKPMQNLFIERELRLFVKKVFDENNIEFPYQKIDVHTK